MIRVILMADLHSNLPALEEILCFADQNSIDQIFSLGDVTGIGPWPGECLDILFNDDRVKMVQGNHEEYVVKGSLPDFCGISENERLHHEWMRGQLSRDQLKQLEAIPPRRDLRFEKTKCTFLHSPWTETETFRDYFHLYNMNGSEMDLAFSGETADLIAFGHTHQFCDHQLSRRIVNPGAAGCDREGIGRFSVLTVSGSDLKLRHHQIRFRKDYLVRELQRREVPDREFIGKHFFGEEL